MGTREGELGVSSVEAADCSGLIDAGSIASLVDGDGSRAIGDVSRIREVGVKNKMMEEEKADIF